MFGIFRDIGEQLPANAQMLAMRANADRNLAGSVGSIACQRSYRDQHPLDRECEEIMHVGVV